ncbi:hypothetical protein MLD38_040252 [Melastoma candidum]|uniref:Uncharacterized protein n=1 Tax=Melastoma candidum TaxID=119954 RepID=A0ACB9L553_9MYRT|nr:hypothetical protein MLD38_040252 [Melastoma candidum]
MIVKFREGQPAQRNRIPMIVDAKGGSVVVFLVCVELFRGIAGHSSPPSSTSPSPLSNSVRNDGKVSAFYVLGDSSVDCGENTLFYPFLHKNLSLHPCSGSDSSLIPHFLAEKMGLGNSPPFYGQNSSVDYVLKGLNFGSAEATIMNFGDRKFQSLNQQIRQALETFQLVQLHLTEEDTREFMESSVTYLSFGKDDYVELFLRNSSSASTPKFTAQEFSGILVNQMTTAVMKLYHANVRKIVCMGILPLGCAPRIVWERRNWTSSEGRERGKTCVQEINELIVQYNTKMQDRAAKLNRELIDVKIVFCDVYQGIMEIIANPVKHGMEDIRGACCGAGWNGALVGCLARAMACRRESAHVWWDLYNPTREVNRLLADSAWSGHRNGLSKIDSICHPVSIQKLVSTSTSASSSSEGGTYNVARQDRSLQP